MALTRYNYRNALDNTFDELFSLRGELGRLFGDLTTGNVRNLINHWAPALDLEENENDFKVDIELPGVKKEDIKVSVENDVLTISGERKQGVDVKEAGRSERYFGKFSRTVTLPSHVDSAGAKAAYKDGVLTVTVPKAESAKPKTVNIED
jgi:HSP20 family protein